MPSKSRKKRLRFHESTQRALCRFVFLWIALAPVLGVASYSVLLRSPWYQSYQKGIWQSRLSENLGGLQVSFESIEFPCPNQFRAYGLVCSNPETGREVLKIAAAKVDIDRSGWSVDLLSPELNGNELQSVMQHVHDWFLCRPQKTASLLRLSLPELRIDDGANKLNLQKVEVGLKPSDSNSILIVKFFLEGQRHSTPAEFRIDRTHTDESTNWHFDSKGIQIPCYVLSERFTSLKYLGSQALFSGRIEWWQTKHTWKTHIQGQAQMVDLGKASIPLQSSLNGFGELSIDDASIINGDLRQLEGTLKSTYCSFHTGWLDRAAESVKLVVGEKNTPWIDLGPKAAASQLGVRFVLTPNGLAFEGISDPNHNKLAAIVSIVGRQAAAYVDNYVAKSSFVSDALAAYSKPMPSPQPSKIARGRR